MALYNVEVFANSKEQPTLLKIAGFLGQNIKTLEVDRSRKNFGTVQVRISTVRSDVLASIQSLENVQTVKPVQ